MVTGNTNESTTPKCYSFLANDIVLNIIDTPGIVDINGEDSDNTNNTNMRILLDFIRNYQEINAICVLLKPSDTRVDVIFKYCLSQLLSHLNRSAANNILFLFADTYKPGNSASILISELSRIRENTPHIDIKQRVGKSTFINALVNYMTYETMDEARDEPICIIPVQFILSDQQTYNEQEILFGIPDSNENTTDSTQSATKSPKCYKFQNNEFILNIIDTPGIGDTDGVEQDNKNMRNLLDFISNYREINAICVLLKPNNARVDVVFKYCLLELFSHLNKSAADNILFLFTNARSTQYAPGDSGPVLKKLLKEVKERPPNVDVKYSRETIYCFDNESFRYLVATVPPNNMQFNEDFKRDYDISWKRSVTECDRLLERIVSLPPHKVMDTLSLNNAKQNILLLTQPLADIANNIANNVKECEAHKRRIFDFRGTIEELQRELYIPSKDIVSTPLAKPKTVCGDIQCCTKENINGVEKVHYRVNCHNPCYLKFSDGNIMGNKGLLECAAFIEYKRVGEDRYYHPSEFPKDNREFGEHEFNDEGLVLGMPSQVTKSDKCFKCKHSYQTHLHINYETRIVTTKIRDENKNKRITTDKEAMEAQQSKMKELDEKIKELTSEQDTITRCMAEFAWFLRHNALTTFNDAFEDYVRHLIDNERKGGSMSAEDNRETIKKLEQLLVKYKYEKEVIQKAMKNSNQNNGAVCISLEDIDKKICELCGLKWNGGLIKKMLADQQQSKAKSHVIAKEMGYRVPKQSSLFRKLHSFIIRFNPFT
ncbi:unnamed protein product [Oppiella nova]|uniref:DUF8206 domain-containing protein n=1 Tax=Oppiella nova TaxID=334625 RepID=A0A7R9QQS0_9ACAR|nr:unnamed protein product [Oppiella nova]CAG2170384.1 unnamed protein product [Oppiella nova]